MRDGDQSQHDSAVYRRAAGRFAGHVRRRHLGRLVVRLAETARDEIGGVRSTKEARGLAELLRLDHLHPVYHGQHGLRSLKELVRSYLDRKSTRLNSSHLGISYAV